MHWVLASAITIVGAGCGIFPEDTPQDPRCPKNWTTDPETDGGCAPPSGYTALLFAEFGGSGIYGFSRLVTPCAAGEMPGVDCGPEMLPMLELALYRPEDLEGGVPVPDAVPAATGRTSSGGVYKIRLDPGEYVMTCVDPYDGQLVTGTAEVKADAVALYAIDLDHSGR